jgi:hypothetical protein
VNVDPFKVSAEAMIRNLMIGLQTARMFGAPRQMLQVGFQPHFDIPAHLPQIYQGFGIESVIAAGSNYREERLIGDDGTSILMARVKRGMQPGDAAYSLSGHVLSLSQPIARLQPIPYMDRQKARFPSPDRVRPSSTAIFAHNLKAFDAATPLPSANLRETEEPIPIFFERSRINMCIEPLGVWYDHFSHDRWKMNLQILHQPLWRNFLQNYLAQSGKLSEATDQRIQERKREIRQAESALLPAWRWDQIQHPAVFRVVLEGTYIPYFIDSPAEEFQIMAFKLPEDVDRGGVIVRGCNRSSEECWVKLTPWRAFATAEVVTLDESPTGGTLAVGTDGTFEFKARPKGILTFWLHD